MTTVVEAERSLPVAEHADVIVCGAGPAGVCAGIAAARAGADTRLIELHGCLGGVWTAGALSWVIDATGKPGLMSEISRKLDRRGARHEDAVCRVSMGVDVHSTDPDRSRGGGGPGLPLTTL